MPDRKSPPRHDPELARALGEVARALEPLEGRRRLLVAVSGGADSVAMLGLLDRLSRREGLTLVLGHVDHGLRAESAQEAEEVAALASSLALSCERVRLQLKRGPGLAARARDARHAALREMAALSGSELIALGHTATDQAETVLMHLTRGSGLDGLSGMPVWGEGLWRPVLGQTRVQTRDLCGLLGLSFCDDPTNRRREHFRVELREDILPKLRAHNPRLEESLGALARRVRDADEALAFIVEAELRDRKEDMPDGQTVSLQGYTGLPREIRTRLVRQLVLDAGSGVFDGGRRIVEDVDRALSVDAHAGRGFTPRKWALGGDRELWVAGGRLGIRAWSE